MRLLYLSHGSRHTGGYAHEQHLFEALKAQLPVESREIRFTEHFKGPLAWLRLGWMASREAKKADTVITVARLAWPVWLAIRRNPDKKMLLVLHNYDPNDGKPKLFYRLLDRFLLNIASAYPERVRVVCVATCWQRLLQKRFGVAAFLYPNLFPDEPYQRLRREVKKSAKLIHLGQGSAKANQILYRKLIPLLEQRGYTCFFSSPEAVVRSEFPVRHFLRKEDYLFALAESSVSIILNRVREGWSRVAHESFLVGTPVICLPGGGLEELTRLAGGRVGHSAEEIMGILDLRETFAAKPELLAPFHTERTAEYVKPIAQWLK
ncbi:MAG: hypothetical protein KJS92_09020 [Bacteroidetes bacterium]|nr:hypothetical protein [Bacteroidota bacterium]